MRHLWVAYLTLAGMLGPAWAKDVIFYVSPDGNDRWSGTLSAPNAARTDGPFATFERAVRAVRQALSAEQKNVTVLFREGTYVLEKTLVFTPEDSGREGHPVVYAAYPGERAVISGGRRITGWRKYNDQLWVATVPKGWYFTRMFVNGRLAMRSREPDTDNWHRWFKVVAGGAPEPDAPEGAGGRQFQFPAGTVKNWPNLGDVEINSLPSYRYANFICPVQSVDEASSTLTLASMAYYNYGPGDPFRVENTLEGIDEPGEWCVNTVEGKVYYLPRPGEDMAAAEVIAPALKELIRFQGDETRQRWVHDIVLRGFTFMHCDRRRWNERDPEDETNLHLLDAAVVLSGTQRCAIEQCHFLEVAGFATRFKLTAINNRFVSNEVVGAGCGGLQAGGYGPGTKDTNKGHEISFNHIHHCSTDWWHAGAIDLRQSGENHIAYNLIHDMPYAAVCISGAHTAYFRQYRGRPGAGRADYKFRWDEIPGDNPLTAESVKPFLHGRNNVVEHNVVYEIGARLPDDGGALYGYAQGLGNIFRNNLVFRSYCLGIYLDNEFDGVLVEGNVVYDCGVPFGGSGEYPTLRDNELYQRGSEPAVVRMLGQHLVRMAEQATGPYWHRTVCASLPLTPPPGRDPARRRFEVSFGGLQEGPLEGQGGWQIFGSGIGIEVVAEGRSGDYDPRAVA
ncbi:MAG: right-handed parallel beta-helix repeat-containing protein, partial [Armatimonadetes bacterium]|nr:right-handed parallel beta-helix repeat-containing protein [Armatimonadota bacterium]